TMTYYGRWTYKFEEAARQGAAGAILIHETDAAGYGWGVVEGSWTGPQFDLVASDGNMSRVAVEAWVRGEVAQELFAAAGVDLEAEKARAATPDFQPIEIPLRASVNLSSSVEQSSSNNVLAVLPGTDRADEYIVYMAHWDHFGTDPNAEGDQIFNGAVDNATGTAGLLEMAEAFASLEERPGRSLLFMAVTAEEQGLLGSAYYATNPVYPRTKTVAAINMDVLNLDGVMRDITVIGYGNSDLDRYVEREAERQGRVVRGDAEPEKGFYYRSDHFSFAKEGIPALYTDPGIDNVEHGEAWTLERREDYTTNRYHKPSDEFDPEWDFSGAIQDLELLFRIGYGLSIESEFPNWTEGTEFRARRDADMSGGTMQR
ncbi:MAG: M28 family metallopeptidase, partial [Gemmatimonadota bacterium]|nr:M28 family metallopeptidase [Gemmatimonadota bacterium]